LGGNLVYSLWIWSWHFCFACSHYFQDCKSAQNCLSFHSRTHTMLHPRNIYNSWV